MLGVKSKLKEIILLRQHESNMGVSVGTGYRLKSSLDPSLKRSSDHIELYVQDVSHPEDVCGENDKLTLVKYFSKDE